MENVYVLNPNSPQKPDSSEHKKLDAVGLAILALAIIAAIGALYMWNNFRQTEQTASVSPSPVASVDRATLVREVLQNTPPVSSSQQALMAAALKKVKPVSTEQQQKMAAVLAQMK